MLLSNSNIGAHLSIIRKKVRLTGLDCTDYLTHISIIMRYSKARTLRIGIKEAAIKNLQVIALDALFFIVNCEERSSFTQFFNISISALCTV